MPQQQSALQQAFRSGQWKCYYAVACSSILGIFWHCEKHLIPME